MEDKESLYRELFHNVKDVKSMKRLLEAYLGKEVTCGHAASVYKYPPLQHAFKLEPLEIGKVYKSYTRLLDKFLRHADTCIEELLRRFRMDVVSAYEKACRTGSTKFCVTYPVYLDISDELMLIREWFSSHEMYMERSRPEPLMPLDLGAPETFLLWMTIRKDV
jgi:hypothetical protein